VRSPSCSGAPERGGKRLERYGGARGIEGGEKGVRAALNPVLELGRAPKTAVASFSGEKF
jgi:hypothetical protein